MASSAWRVILECGGAMSLVAGGYLVLLLRLWPRVFLRRYPEAVRQAVAPLAPRERVIGFAVALPLLAALLAFPMWASYRVASVGNAPWSTVFWVAYGTWMVFNLFDWLVLDELVVGLLRPSWLVLPGAEHVPLTFDHAEHAAGFVRGSVGGAAVSLVIAVAVHLSS